MFANKVHMRVGTYIILGLTIVFLLCIGAAALLNKADKWYDQPPVRRFRVTIAEDQQQKFYDQLRKFADKYAFEYYFADFGTRDETVQVEMLHDNIKIIAIVTRADPGYFSVGFYGASPVGPRPDEKVIGELEIELKKYINEIPNVTITEDK